MTSEEITIGIDFGTTFACVGAYVDGKVDIIPNEHGKRLTPCYVAFTEEERLFGETAKYQAPLNAGNTLYNAKQLMGRLYNDPSVNYEGKMWGFTIEKDETNRIQIPVIYKENGRKEKILLYPEQISAMILGRMKKIAEGYFGTKVIGAVISVPACFTNAQRQATMNAGQIAGMDVIGLINEPTAAALAYSFDNKVKEKRHVVVFNFGSSSLEMNSAKMNGNELRIRRIEGTCNIGGTDFDDNLFRYFANKYQIDCGDKRNLIRLKEACEKLKRSLSGALRAHVQVYIASLDQSMDLSLTREEFEKINEKMFHKIEKIVKTFAVELENEQVDDVILVGGSTRIPAIRDILMRSFHVKKLNKTVNPDEAIAYGAAIYSAVLSKNKMTEDCSIRDAVPLSLVSEQTVLRKYCRLPYDEQLCLPVKYLKKENSIIKICRGIGEISETIQLPSDRLPPLDAGTIKIHVNINKLGIISYALGEDKLKLKSEMINEDNIEKQLSENNRFNENDESISQLNAAKNEIEKYIYYQKQNIKKLHIKEKYKQDFMKMCEKTIGWMEKYQNKKEEVDYQEKIRSLKMYVKIAEEKTKLESYIERIKCDIERAKYNFSGNDKTRLLKKCLDMGKKLKEEDTTDENIKACLVNMKDEYEVVLKNLKTSNSSLAGRQDADKIEDKRKHGKLMMTEQKKFKTKNMDLQTGAIRGVENEINENKDSKVNQEDNSVEPISNSRNQKITSKCLTHDNAPLETAI